MTLQDLLDRWTAVTMDKEDPQFWPTARRVDLLNEAMDEAAMRGRLIDTDQLTVSITAGDPYAVRPAHAWSIREVTLDGRRLQLVDREMLDASEPDGWEDITGTPIAVCDIDGRLRFYPTPELSATVKVRAFCVPAIRLNASDLGAEPGIPEREHSSLLDYALSVAYLDMDSDALDPQRAARHEAAFERRYGPALTAATLRRIRLSVRSRVSGVYF